MDARSRYLKYKLIVVVFRCPRSKETVGLANFKLKSDPYLGHGPMGRKLQINIMQQWLHVES